MLGPAIAAPDYLACTTSFAVTRRDERAWLVITGRDRAAWLHNLTTNAIKTLHPGDGNYAFALNVQGRILFDLNAMVTQEAIHVDLDQRWLPLARKHFDKYTITEDVKCDDQSGECRRMALIGPGVSDLLASLGVPQASAWPLLGLRPIRLFDVDLLAFRSDFCGPFAIELSGPTPAADEVWRNLMNVDQTQPMAEVSEAAIGLLRIEHGIPAPGREITDEYLPAETRQLHRAVSFQKGCYLGQEVVERMRSRQVVARQLALLRLDSTTLPSAGAEVLDSSGKPVGNVTSACVSPKHGRAIALAYVKTSAATDGTALTVRHEQSTLAADVIPLPSATPR